MRYLTIIALMFMPNLLKAQQDAIYSQYMFNPMAINPAYAGSRQAFSSVFLLREQWSGIDGAPSTGSIALHGPIKGKNFALGFNMVHDELGPLKSNAAYFTYAYHVPMSKGKLSLALRGGIYGASYNFNLLNYNDPGDKYNQAGVLNDAVPTFDFGAYYYTDKFFAGLSVTHMEGARLQFINDTVSNILELKQHYMGYSGVAIEVSDDIVLKPSVLIKHVPSVPLNIDLNASVLIKKVFWFGVSYRHKNALALITEYNIKDWIRLGYSYDMILNRLSRFTAGSHELMLGFDFRLKKDKNLSPRYM